MGKAEYKVKGGKLIRIQLAQRGTRIESVKITGDFFLHPETLIEQLEKELKGLKLHETNLAGFIKSLINREGATLLGASPEDIANCIMMAVEKNE
jgi:lipoate-protein ligase A